MSNSLPFDRHSKREEEPHLTCNSTVRVSIADDVATVLVPLGGELRALPVTAPIHTDISGRKSPAMRGRMTPSLRRI